MSLVKNISRKICEDISNKRVDELSNNLRNFVLSIFDDASKEDVIKCKYKKSGKINLIMECKGTVKNVSVLQGRFNKRERIYDFIKYLKSIDVSNETINSILSYHFAYCKNNVFGEELHSLYVNEIDKVREEFNNKNKMLKVIQYIFSNRESGREIDYFYLGDSRYGLTLSKNVFYEMLLNHTDNYHHKYMRIGVFNLLPLSRINHCDDHLKNILIIKLNLSTIIKK